MVTVVPEDIRQYPHMVAGATEGFRQYPHMTTEAQEEISYYSPSSSTGKQKKARFPSQSQFPSEKTPATIEAHQILLALQQLVTNSSSANFKSNISRILELPESLTTILPTFDGKLRTVRRPIPNKFEKTQSADGRRQKNYFHSLMHDDALHFFKNITGLKRENLGDF